MKNIDYTTVEEILTSDGFLKWYQQIDEKEVRGWNEWMEQHSDRQRLVKEAMRVLELFAASETQHITEQQIHADASRLIEAIRKMKAGEDLPSKTVRTP